jgi:hypothetical protein
MGMGSKGRVVEESVLKVGGGHAALGSTPEPVVSVSGNPSVHGVAEGAREEKGGREKRPGAAEVSCNPKGSRRPDVGPIVFNENERAQVGGGQIIVQIGASDL